MPKPRLLDSEINRIRYLRKTGSSLREIKNETKKSSATISKYIKNVKILNEYKEVLKIKRGGSKIRSQLKWQKISSEAKLAIPSPLSRREKLCILASLYWGEGNKTELILTNTDPALIKTFVSCLREIGVKSSDLKVNIRLYENLDREKSIKYWAKIIGIKSHDILGVNVLKGKKESKLEYGMCRIRVKKGGNYFKYIMSVIALIKVEFAAVVQRIERGTPKP